MSNCLQLNLRQLFHLRSSLFSEKNNRQYCDKKKHEREREKYVQMLKSSMMLIISVSIDQDWKKNLNYHLHFPRIQIDQDPSMNVVYVEGFAQVEDA